jgi:hypothetical protein
VINTMPQFSGWDAWLYYWPGDLTGDELVDQNTGQLTAYGQQIAGAMPKAGAPTGGGTTTSPPPSTLPASPDGTKITSAAGKAIIDASGNSWTLVQSAANGLQVAVNGVVDTSTANVVLLETLGGKILQENSANTWYSEPGPQGPWAQITAPAGGTTGTGTTTPPPANQPVLIKPGVGSFTDTAGNVYTLSATGDADENGQLMGGGTGTGAMELANGVIYGQDAASLSWYTWNQTAWTPSAAPPSTTTTGGGTTTPPPPPPAASPDGTSITLATASPIIDAAGNAWSLVQSAASGLQVAVNGHIDTTTANVKLLEILSGKMVQENTAGTWYSEPGTSGPWTQITAPAGSGTTTGGGTTAPPPPPTPVSTGTGSDTLVLSISEDAYQGNALFTVSVDGKQLAGTFTATASHAAGASQSFTFNGDWAPGAHAVAVNFLNDAYGGTATTDRNLYVNGVTYDGANTGQSAALMGAGPKSFSVTDTTAVPSPAIGSGSDTMVLAVSEDAYQGDAQRSR